MIFPSAVLELLPAPLIVRLLYVNASIVWVVVAAYSTVVPSAIVLVWVSGNVVAVELPNLKVPE